jgi:hypothetical protein
MPTIEFSYTSQTGRTEKIGPNFAARANDSSATRFSYLTIIFLIIFLRGNKVYNCFLLSQACQRNDSRNSSLEITAACQRLHCQPDEAIAKTTVSHRVARFLMAQLTKTGNKIPNREIKYQMGNQISNYHNMYIPTGLP